LGTVMLCGGLGIESVDLFVWDQEGTRIFNAKPGQTYMLLPDGRLSHDTETFAITRKNIAVKIDSR